MFVRGVEHAQLGIRALNRIFHSKLFNFAFGQFSGRTINVVQKGDQGLGVANERAMIPTHNSNANGTNSENSMTPSSFSST